MIFNSWFHNRNYQNQLTKDYTKNLILRSKMIERDQQGLIGFYQLSNWWGSLTNDQQKKIKQHYSITGKNPNDLDRGRIKINTSVSNFLWPIGLNAISLNDFDNALLILEKSLELTTNVTDRHFALMGLVDLFYKQRDILPQALEYCERYCLLDIEIAEQFIYAFREQDAALRIYSQLSGKDTIKWFDLKDKGFDDATIVKNLGYNLEKATNESILRLPSYPSFPRLAIIYEKSGRYQEAIDICEKAMQIEIKDVNKKSFSDRIKKLKNKQSKLCK